MLLTEYNEAEAMELFKEEGRAEGEFDSIKSLMETTGWSVNQIMDALKIPAEKRYRYLIKLKEDEIS